MKRIGMVGGLSYESTAKYYLDINKKAMQRLEGYNQLEIVLVSVNFNEVMHYAGCNDWNQLYLLFMDAAIKLERARVDFIVIPCNSFHIIADRLQQAINVPLLNIIDCVASYIQSNSYSKVALLGTKFTMENGFYRDRLLKKFNIKTEIPNREDRDNLHDIIFKELCYGLFTEKSKNFINNLCENLQTQKNCEAVILGCTELPMILRPSDTQVPLILSTDIHADCIVDYCLEQDVI